MIKVAHFGTFDVDNYGDLLFPHIAEYRLPNFQWEHVSPTNNLTVFKDSKSIISFDVAKKKDYDAIVSGGGNIIHLSHNTLTVYKNINGFAYANLWVGAAKIAIKSKIPHIFNSPGISQNFTSFIKNQIASSTFKNSNYLAFRERFSKDIADSLIKGKNAKSHVYIIPDTAFEIDKLWPLEQFEGSSYIAVNLNNRYHSPIVETALILDEISEKLKIPIKFVVIGACHGDKEFTKKVSSVMRSKHFIVESNSLKKVAHVIGNSKYFLGSSMHGFITALSYGVPALLVLNKTPMHKFIGLLEITELDRNVICSSLKDVLEHLNCPALLTSKVKLRIQSDLDIHWNKINEIINNKESPGFSAFIIIFEKLLSLNLKCYKLYSKFK